MKLIASIAAAGAFAGTMALSGITAQAQLAPSGPLPEDMRVRHCTGDTIFSLAQTEGKQTVSIISCPKNTVITVPAKNKCQYLATIQGSLTYAVAMSAVLGSDDRDLVKALDQSTALFVNECLGSPGLGKFAQAPGAKIGEHCGADSMIALTPPNADGKMAYLACAFGQMAVVTTQQICTELPRIIARFAPENDASPSTPSPVAAEARQMLATYCTGLRREGPR